ncbi:MAG: tetratricopeptide repeat protein [Verrucomicrobiales bacterium]|nr:tetratricopeptide repeat protein [Verrucomicrobiales bacterium]
MYRFLKQRIGFPAIFLAGLIAVAVGGNGKAQLINGGDLPGAFQQIRYQIQVGNYDVGLRMLDMVYQYWGDDPGAAIGDRFGHFLYLKGLLYLGKADYNLAIAAFEQCYEDYPNDEENLFRIHALSQWGTCLILTEDYEEAVQILEKAYTSVPLDNTEIDKTLIALNLGRAYLRTAQMEEGLKILRRILDHEDGKREHRQSAFMILAEDWTPEIELPEARSFVAKYGELVRNDSFKNRWPRNDVFLFLAQQAIENDEPLRALLWYGQLLPPSEIAEYVRADFAHFQTLKPDEAEVQRLAMWAKINTEKQLELKYAEETVANVLYGAGAAHFRIQNHTASFATFQHLADVFPTHPMRAEILHNVVASAVKLERWTDIRDYGIKFLDGFPEHDLVGDVARMMCDYVFARGEYEEAWTTSQEVRKRLRIASDPREVPDFVAGGSLFHLERYREARIELEAYEVHFPDGERMEPVQYYLGASNVKELRWETAARIFDAFLIDYPGSGMRPGVLYLNGLSHFALGNYPLALTLVEELHANHPMAEELPASWNLKGDLLAVQNPPAAFAEIEACYLKAREMAQADPKPESPDIDAYALWKLTALHDAASSWETAVAHFDEFQEKFPESFYRLDTLSAALRGLHHVGRTREAIGYLEENLLVSAKTEDQASLDELMGSYLDYISQTLKPDEAIEVVRNFKTRAGDISKPITLWLQIAEIEHLEKLEQPPEADLEKRYFDLEVAADLYEMPNFGLIKLARRSSKKMHYNRARELYLKVIEDRPDRGFLEMAVLDMAKIDASSTDPVAAQRAIENFSRIIDEFENPEMQEMATAGLARVLMEKEKFDLAAQYWELYRSQPQWIQNRAEANFNLAQCYEKTSDTDSAIKLYAITYVNFPGHLDWSTPSYLRAAELLKEDGRDGDALLVLVDFLKRLGHLEHDNIRKGRRLFQKWKAEWVENQANGGTKS